MKTAARAAPDAAARIRLLLDLLPPAGRFGQRQEWSPAYRPDVDAAESGALPETQWTDAWVEDVATDGGPGATTVGAVETLWQIGVAVQAAPAAVLAQVRPMGAGAACWYPAKWLAAAGVSEGTDPALMAARVRDTVPGIRAAERGWLWHGLPGGIGHRTAPPGNPYSDVFVLAMAELDADAEPADPGVRRWLLGVLAAL